MTRSQNTKLLRSISASAIAVLQKQKLCKSWSLLQKLILIQSKKNHLSLFVVALELPCVLSKVESPSVFFSSRRSHLVFAKVIKHLPVFKSLTNN